MIFTFKLSFAVAKNKQSLTGFVVQHEYFDIYDVNMEELKKASGIPPVLIGKNIATPENFWTPMS
ncbi:MAG TPA: hypothetical protein VEW65_10085 [Chryseolinea sp.]|nr:hypothetical protein [Chryseolinea sp.]